MSIHSSPHVYFDLFFLWKAIWEQREYNYQSADSLIAEPETPASRRPSCARAWYPARESQRQARMPQGSPGSDSALPVLLVLLRNTLPPLVLRIPLHDTSPNRTRLILHFLFPLLISGSYYFCRLVPCPSECSASTSLLLECVLIPSSPRGRHLQAVSTQSAHTTNVFHTYLHNY